MPLATPERRVQCIRIVPKVGDMLRIAIAYSDDLIMDGGVVYTGGLYTTNTAISATLSGGPTVLDIGSVYSTDAITRDQIQSGYWDGAKIYSFFTDWAAPIEDEEPDRVYGFGKVREEDGRYTVEVLSLTDLLGQTTGRDVTPGCLWTLADSRIDGTLIATDKSLCKIDPATITFDSQVGSLINQMQFIGVGLDTGFADDYFSFGEIIFTSGQNSGLGYKFVKSSLDDGTITLAQPFYYPISAGDLFLIKAGCRKRFQEDCIEKHSNGIHFGGFPDVPQKSTVQKFGDQ